MVLRTRIRDWGLFSSTASDFRVNLIEETGIPEARDACLIVEKNFGVLNVKFLLDFFIYSEIKKFRIKFLILNLYS